MNNEAIKLTGSGIKWSFIEFQFVKTNTLPNSYEIEYIKSFCQLIEVIYDPYLTWRNFLHKNYADYKRTSCNTVQLHVELVPFVYGKVTFIIVNRSLWTKIWVIPFVDCFQSDNILEIQDVGINLIHMLGSVISGSQVCLFYWSFGVGLIKF